MHPEARLSELGFTLPPPPAPLAAYVPSVRSGDLLFLSGQGPIAGDMPLPTGKVPTHHSVEDAQRLARITCLNSLAIVKAEVGDLAKVERVVKLTVFVASAPGFNEQHLVANGASELLADIFGESGRHARAAVGVPELPMDIPVEIESVFQVAS